jgi:dienelactone hydrolase
MKPTLAAAVLAFALSTISLAQSPPPAPTPADAMLADYFRAETRRIEQDCLRDIKSPQGWEARRSELRRQLFEMLSLDPLPERTDLRANITGSVDHAAFRVENLHFQSRPGLYVTGNLYLPKNLDKPAPAVLYVCGHSHVKKDNISYGNKTAYQHHAAWFASNGYVCLVIDTLQLGEIEGIHHGTYRENMWWWLSRGYTPAGVEAWNCIRALDYLQSRKEVDGARLGVTGRSGGGAYSWWLTALDDRIKAAVPVAGITDLHNHVVDGCVEGHCDCMFIANTYRWDYPAVAALAAPRPLLITNTDKDGIFPLDGVMRLYWKVRTVYGLGAADTPYRPFKKDLGIQISEGGHVDSPELQVAAFRWFNRFLKGDDQPIDTSTAKKLFEPEQLRVFKDGLPTDAINPRVHDTFVPTAPAPSVPQSAESWAQQRDAWMQGLTDKCFRGWPDNGGGPLDLKEAYRAESTGVVLRAYDFSSQPHVRLRLHVLHAAGVERPQRIVCNVLDEEAWKQWLARLRPGFEQQLKGEVTGELPSADAEAFGRMPQMLKQSNWAIATIAPRGIGPGKWSGDDKKQIQIRRRFMLLGQTRDTMRVWDVRRAVQALRSLPEMNDAPLRLQGHDDLAGVALYASLFEPAVTHLHLVNLPRSHVHGPHFLNVLRVLDTPQALAMAAENRQVRIYAQSSEGWDYAVQTAKALKWPEDRIEFRQPE